LGSSLEHDSGDDKASFRHPTSVAESFLCPERCVSYVLKQNTATPTDCIDRAGCPRAACSIALELLREINEPGPERTGSREVGIRFEAGPELVARAPAVVENALALLEIARATERLIARIDTVDRDLISVKNEFAVYPPCIE
jgi:hypothetical protein